MNNIKQAWIDLYYQDDEKEANKDKASDRELSKKKMPIDLDTEGSIEDDNSITKKNLSDEKKIIPK